MQGKQNSQILQETRNPQKRASANLITSSSDNLKALRLYWLAKLFRAHKCAAAKVSAVAQCGKSEIFSLAQPLALYERPILADKAPSLLVQLAAFYNHSGLKRHLGEFSSPTTTIQASFATTCLII